MTSEQGTMRRRRDASVGNWIGLLVLAFLIIAASVVINRVLIDAFWVSPIPIPVVVCAVAFFLTVRSRSPWLALAVAAPAVGLAAWTIMMAGSESTIGEQMNARLNASLAFEALLTAGAGAVAGVIWNRRVAALPRPRAERTERPPQD
ncbi:MAG: hypothetical protein KGK07_07975 [Chloroflexota bacterium]|nr:hypothetical protein [Chloroflexota bacterium]